MKNQNHKVLITLLLSAGLLSACNGGSAQAGGGQTLQGAPMQSTQTVKSLFVQNSQLTAKLNVPSNNQWYIGNVTLSITNTGSSDLDLSKTTLGFTSQDIKGKLVNAGKLDNWSVAGHNTAYHVAFTSGNGNAQIGQITADNGNATIKAGETITFTGGFNLNGSEFDIPTAQNSLVVDGTPEPAPTPDPKPTPDPTPTPTPGDNCSGIPSWEAKDYPAGNTHVQYNGVEYKNKWWTGSGEVPGKADVWAFEFKCDGTPPAPVVTVGELDVVVDTTNTDCKGSSACHGLTAHVKDANGNDAGTFVVPDSALGGVYTQAIESLQAGVVYSVTTDSITDTTVAYTPITAKATVVKDSKVSVSAKYSKNAPAAKVGKATVSLANVVPNYTGDLTVQIVNNDASGAVVGTYTLKQGASFTTENLPVSDAGHSYSVKLLNGLADPKAGLFYVESGSAVVAINDGQTTSFAIPMIKSSKTLRKVAVDVSGLEGSDVANVSFEDAGHTYVYVNDLAKANGKFTYYTEDQSNFGIHVTASGTNAYTQAKFDFSGVIKDDATVYSAAFIKQITPPAPTTSKVNATYWSLWGNNTSYNIAGGSYQSVAVDAPNIDASYNLIIASFIVTDLKGNYVLATSDPGAQTPQTPYYSDQQMIYMINQVKAQKRKVIISLGGQYFHLQMKTIADKDNFVTQVEKIIDKYGFEGIDLDLEGSATSADTNLLAQGVMEVVSHYRNQEKEFLLTMAPEWLYISPARYGCGQWGSGSYANTFYIDLIRAIGVDNISYVMPQTYNQGPANGVCGNTQNKVSPTDGMDKFVAALAWSVTTESGLQVSTNGVSGTLMPLIPSSKFVIGIPATVGAAGGEMSYIMTPEQIVSAWNIMNNTYGVTAGGFMNWAADWDATPYANVTYNFTHKAWDTGRAIQSIIFK